MTQTIIDQFYDESVFSFIEITHVESERKNIEESKVALVLVNHKRDLSINEKLEYAYRWIQNPADSVFPEQINGNEYIIRAPSLNEHDFLMGLGLKNNFLDIWKSLSISVMQFDKKTLNKPDPIPLGTLNFEWDDGTHEKNEKVFGLRSTSIGDFMTLDNVKYEVSEVELKEVK